MNATPSPDKPLAVPSAAVWLLRRTDPAAAKALAGEWVTADRRLYLPKLEDEALTGAHLEARRAFLEASSGAGWAPVAWRSHWPTREGVAPQARFIVLRSREGLTGGAKGGGKSDGLVVAGLPFAEHPGFQGMLIRPSVDELAGLIRRSAEIIPEAFPGAEWSKGERAWRWPQGGELKFRHCDPRRDDAKRLAGAPVTFLGIDELTFQTQASYDLLLSCVRSSHAGLPAFVRATCNPGGVGHHWVRARFVDGANADGWTTDAVTGERRAFVRSWLADNPSLLNDAGYRAALEGLADEALRKAFLEGDWDAFSGSVFRLVPGKHVLSWQQFKARWGHDRIPPHWTRFRLLDWGYAKPYAVLWIALDPDGNAIVYRELYGAAKDGAGRTIPDMGARHEVGMVAEKIARIEREAGETVSAGWAGPDLFAVARRDYGESRPLSEEFAAQGVHFLAWDAAPGSRKTAKQHLHQRLKGDRPAIVWIAEEAPESIRTLPLLERDPHNPEDVDTAGEDHLYDATKAFCLMRPWAPVDPRPLTWEEQFEAQQYQGTGWVPS